MPRLRRRSDLSTPATCENCGASSHVRICAWTRVCCVCGLWQALLERAPVETLTDPVNQKARARGLSHVRVVTADMILDRVSLCMHLEGSHLLDVGCAYGWFLEAARRRGAVGVGIEPDKEAAAIARSRGLRVIEGNFPTFLDPKESFDVIAFNNVFEHIGNLHANIVACNRSLRTNGLLVLDVPTSSGLLFCVAKLLARLGWLLPWERLWQKGFPSPHLYYFNSANLDRALTMHGFERVSTQGTEAFHPRGLWSRLRLDRRTNVFLSVFLYAVLLAGYLPYKMVGRSDTLSVIYRKRLDSEWLATRSSRVQ
jgi:SAM-dependent methyltransferase